VDAQFVFKTKRIAKSMALQRTKSHSNESAFFFSWYTVQNPLTPGFGLGDLDYATLKQTSNHAISTWTAGFARS
jgi:hypothetical protein